MFTVNNSFIYTDPSKLPISFKYDGFGNDKKICGIPESFNPIVTSTEKDGVTKTVFCGTNADGLEVKVECTTYKDFPVVEYTAYVTNKADTDSKLVRELRIFDGFIEGSNPVVTYGTGDTTELRGYEIHTEQLDERLILEPVYGTPCNGASPFIKLRFDEYELRLAIGWLGKWKAYFQKDRRENYGVSTNIGQSRCSIKLHPGETIRTPSLTIMCSNLSDEDSTNLWRKWFRKYVMPKVDSKPFPPMQTVCVLYRDFRNGAEQPQTSRLKHLKNMPQRAIWATCGGLMQAGTTADVTGHIPATGILHPTDFRTVLVR